MINNNITMIYHGYIYSVHYIRIEYLLEYYIRLKY